jgi:hypothetical protein
VSAVCGHSNDAVAEDQRRRFPFYVRKACANSHAMFGNVPSSCGGDEESGCNSDTATSTTTTTTTVVKGGILAEEEDTTRRTPLYFEVFELHPMQINMTFSRVPENRAEEYSGVNPLRILIDAMQRIDRAEISLRALLLHHPLTSADLLFEIVKQHYVRQLKSQIMNVVGAISTLGNPAGLVRNIGTGAHDLVFESYQGLVRSPEEFVLGVGRGANSFVKHSVVGVFNSASLITQHLGMNIAALSMDHAFSQGRSRQFEAPRGVLSGLGGGAKAFGRGVAGGVQTLLTAPIEGAKEGFASGRIVQGFGQGLAKGIAGMVVKPLVGASEMASNVLGGIASSAELTMTSSSVLEHGGGGGSGCGGGGTVEGGAASTNGMQVRPPRAVYGRERAIRAYSREDAHAQQLMWLRNRQQHDFYLEHVALEHKVIVLTSRRLLVYGMEGKCLVEIQWRYLQGVAVRRLVGVGVKVGGSAHSPEAAAASYAVVLSEIRPSSAPSRIVSNLFGLGNDEVMEERIVDVGLLETAQSLVRSLEEILSQR